MEREESDLEPGTRNAGGMRVRAHDEEAFAELMRRYRGSLVPFFAGLSRDADLAEDLFQETFLRLWRARERYLPTAKFSTYLLADVSLMTTLAYAATVCVGTGSAVGSRYPWRICAGTAIEIRTTPPRDGRAILRRLGRALVRLSNCKAVLEQPHHVEHGNVTGQGVSGLQPPREGRN